MDLLKNDWGDMMKLEKKIQNGWEISAEGFSDILHDDFQDEKRRFWTELILSNAPKDGKLKILDVGTGPGFFATILAMAGHEVTGIDISPKMLECASKNAERFGVSPSYEVMNSQDITFEAESFDMIVSRNVVWSMEFPKRAYASWLRALVPGGRVVVFDGDHLRDLRDSEFRNECKQLRKEYIKTFGEEPKVSYTDYKTARGWRVELPLAMCERPNWDIATMIELGYTNIQCKDISQAIYCDERSKLLYKNSAFFMLTGDNNL